MDIQQKIRSSIEKALEKLGVSGVDFQIEHPADLSHGDFSANVAMVAAKQIAKNPKDLAEQIVELLRQKDDLQTDDINVAGPGFINFHLTKEFFEEALQKGLILEQDLNDQNILIEHTSPNAFKPLHIGHFMANTIGESIARLLEARGAKVTRATYGSDIGLPAAKAVWGMGQLQAEMPDEESSLSQKMEFIGNAYAHASGLYEKDPEIKTQIDEINIHIYKDDEENIKAVYQKGRRWSLAYLEEMYAKLDTEFDYRFYESEVFEEGTRVVKEHLGKIFEESEGAVVFKGEDHGLHTRVFLTSKGAPTYEAKEIGLHYKKSAIPFDTSIVVTGNEQAGVMQVGLKAFEQIDPETAKKTQHISHGLMLGTDGKKLSSRKGGSLSAEELIKTVSEEVSKIVEKSEVVTDKEATSQDIAIGALRYQILKQGSGKNIVFDLDQAVSFEGDSGPYLQYTLARLNSLLEKADEENVVAGKVKYEESADELFKKLYRFSEIVERAGKEYAPQYLTTFLIEISGAFNGFYANEKIIDQDNPEATAQRLALVSVVKAVLEKGMYILNIPRVHRM